MKRATFTAAALFVLAAVWLFVYNSGFGYDALEYLVIGRSLRDGYPFYAFIPSKSWALYYLLAGYLTVPAASTHVGVSLLITIIILVICLATYRVTVQREWSPRAAAGAAALVGVGALFMELNFLQPTGFVYLSGLLAFDAVTASHADQRRGPWFGAGLSLGIGMAFKSVAAFYFVALVLWIAGRTFMRGRDHQRALAQVVYVLIGFVLAVGPQVAYFAMSGRLQPYLEWSYLFPFVYFPSRTEFFAKLYTKLLWIWLVVFFAAGLSIRQSIRGLLYRDEKVWLLLAFGVFGLLALFKLQASHYAFPGAAFLLIYAAVVFDRWLAGRFESGARLALPLAVCVLVGCLVSIGLYRPAALSRLYTIRSFEAEGRQRAAFQALVKPTERAIFFNQNLPLYWVSERYPTWPILHTDVQATYFVERHTADLLGALDDPRLVLVEFDPAATSYDDERFSSSPTRRAFLQAMRCRLEAGFTRHDDLLRPLVLWTPRTGREPSASIGKCQ